jgi:hypothetical protein
LRKNEIQTTQDDAHCEGHDQYDNGQIGRFLAAWPGNLPQLTHRLAEIALNPVRLPPFSYAFLTFGQSGLLNLIDLQPGKLDFELLTNVYG